jgi:IstB-like ATP binding protein
MSVRWSDTHDPCRSCLSTISSSPGEADNEQPDGAVAGGHDQSAVQNSADADAGPQFGTLAEQAIREKQSHMGYLEALLLSEIEERERNTIERRIREAHLPRVKTLEEFDYTQSPNVTAAKMRDLAEGG